MATITTITRKPSNLKSIQMLTDVDMHQALANVAALPSNTYSGNVNVTNNGGTLVWQLWINNQATSNTQAAVIGDYVIIENNANASICKQADYSTLYQ